MLFVMVGAFSFPNKVQAQTLNTETSVPVLSVCGAPGTVTLIIEKGSAACNTGELKIDLPSGFEYVSGTLKIDGVLHTPEATSNSSGLDVKLPNISARTTGNDKMTITYDVRALCDAVITNEPVITYDFKGCGNDQVETSEAFNIVYAVLNASIDYNGSTNSGVLGTEITRKIKIKNTGLGTISDNVKFTINMGSGLEQLSLNSDIAGVTITSLGNGVYEIDNFTFAQNSELVLTQVVKITDCINTNLNTVLTAEYACDNGCSVPGTSSTVNSQINFDTGVRPNLVASLLSSNIQITCLNQEYTERVKIVNNGRGVSEKGFLTLFADTNPQFSNLSVGSTVTLIRNGDTTTATVVETTPHPTTNIYGLSGKNAKIKVEIPNLNPNEEIELQYKVYYAGPDANVPCQDLQKSYSLSRLNYSIEYQHLNDCSTDTYGGTGSFRQSSSYSVNGYNVGDLDVYGTNYSGIYFFSNIEFAPTGLGTGASFSIKVQFSNNLTVDPASLKLVQGSNLISSSNFVHLGGNLYEYKFVYGTPAWPSGNTLNLNSIQLRFDSQFDCNVGGETFYTISTELDKGGTCTTPNVIYFKCDKVSLNSRGCGTGLCPEGGMVNFDSEVYRITTGYDPSNPSTLLAPRSTGTFENAFTSHDILEFKQTGIVIEGTAAPTGWKRVRFEVSLNDANKYNLITNSGKVVVKRGGNEILFDNIQPTISTSGLSQVLRIDFTVPAGALAGDVLKQDDEISVYVRARDNGNNTVTESRLFFSTEIYLLDDNNVPHVCSGGYSASAFYVKSEADFVVTSGTKEITGCDILLPGASFTAKVAGISKSNVVFTEENRYISKLNSVDIIVPAEISLSGYRLILKGNGADKSFDYILPSPVSGATSTIDLTRPDVTAQLGNLQQLDEGFTLDVRPILTSTCNNLNTAVINFSGNFSVRKLQGQDIVYENRVVNRAVTYSLDNQKLSIGVATNDIVVPAGEGRWIVKVTNSSSFRQFNNVWLKQNGGQGTITSITESNSAGNTAGKSPLVPNQGYYLLGDIDKSTTKYYVVVADLPVDCLDGAIPLLFGESCIAFDPNSVCIAPRTQPELKYKRGVANLQMEMKQNPLATSRPALCDPLDFEIKINNGGTGFAKDIKFRIPLDKLNSLKFVENSLKISQEYSTGNPTLSFTDLASTTHAIEGNELVISLGENVMLKNNSSFHIRFALAFEGCDFVSGNRIGIKLSGKNFCGSVAAVGPQLNSERITIGSEENFIEPRLEIIQPTQILMDFTNPSVENNVKGLYSYSFKNLADPAVKDIIHFSIKLPANWSFVDAAEAVDGTKAQFVEFDVNKGYIFKLIDDLGTGEVFSILNAPIVYGGNAADIDCTENFGKSEERIYAVLTPKQSAQCTLVCDKIEHDIFFTGTNFINTTPPKPTGDAAQTLCEAGPLNSVTLADLVISNAHNIQWFATADLTQPLPLNTDLVNGVTYYVRNKWNDGIECYSDALAVTVTLEKCFVVIKGKVFNDINGNTDNTVNGEGTNLTNTLYANLIDPAGLVAESVLVNTDGTYLLSYAYQNTNGYVVQISTNSGVVGNTAPEIVLPEGWVHTGDYPNNVNDNTPNGSITVNTTHLDVENINFGIEQRPTAVGDDADSQINPGGTNFVNVPANLFAGTDPDNGKITAIVLTQFPSNLTSIEIDGVVYKTISAITTAYPQGIPTTANGNIAVPVRIDPIDGSVEVEFDFKVKDDAGFESLQASQSSMPFIARNPQIELVKTASNPSANPVVGEEVTYTFTVENKGNVPLKNVKLTEVSFSGSNNDPLEVNFVSATNGSIEGELIVGEIATYRAIYKMTQSDVDAGKLTNEAKTSGYDVFQPGVDSTHVESSDTELVKLPHNPSITLEKTGLYKGNTLRAEIGDEVDYQFVFTNTGNVTLTNIQVLEDHMFSGTGAPIQLSVPNVSTGSTINALAPNGTITYTATYKITQADIDAGEVINQAVAKATSPKTDDNPNGIDVEDLSDDPNDGTNTDSEGDGEPDDPTRVEIPQLPLIEVTKEGRYLGDPKVSYPGDEVEYIFTVYNTGNVTLSNVNIQDIYFTGKGNPLQITYVNGSRGATPSSFTPGEKLTYRAVYKIVQDDIYLANIFNQAEVSATPPNSNTPIKDLSDDPNISENLDPEGDGEPDDVTIVKLPRQPSVEVEKKAVFNDEGNIKGQAEVGETITYTFRVINTGNVELENVRLLENSFSGAGDLPKPQLKATSPQSSEFKLMPGGELIYEAVYTILQGDINTGKVINQAIVKAFEPQTGDEIDDLSDDPNDPTNRDTEGDGEPDDPTVVVLPSTSQISLLKDGVFNDENKNGLGDLGETITYTFTITNSGLTTINNIVLSDPLISGSINLPKTTLTPGEVMTATATYSLRQSDLDRGGVYNIATVKGNDPSNKPVQDDSNDPTPLNPNDPNHPGVDPSCPDCTIVPTPGNPGIEIEKNTTTLSFQNIGDKIKYVIKVTNTGSVTLNNVVVTDVLLPNWSQTISTLAPGQSQQFEVEYVVKAEDIENGKVLNVAKVKGEDPKGNEVEDEDDKEVPFKAVPSISIEKTADKTLVKEAGEAVNYTLIVTNNGNVDLSNVIVRDPMTGFEQNIGFLKSGEIRNFVITYIIKPTDLSKSVLVNIATVEGTTPDGPKVTDEDKVEIPVQGGGEEGPFKIPNVFTPNGDGINDNFEIVGIGQFDRVEILVFNRWGNEVYRNSNYRNNWNGLNLNVGTYYYIINTYKGSTKKEYTGWVLLRRD